VSRHEDAIQTQIWRGESCSWSSSSRLVEVSDALVWLLSHAPCTSTSTSAAPPTLFHQHQPTRPNSHRASLQRCVSSGPRDRIVQIRRERRERREHPEVQKKSPFFPRFIHSARPWVTRYEACHLNHGQDDPAQVRRPCCQTPARDSLTDRSPPDTSFRTAPTTPRCTPSQLPMARPSYCTATKQAWVCFGEGGDH
jgi:hypothetical protein